MRLIAGRGASRVALAHENLNPNYSPSVTEMLSFTPEPKIEKELLTLHGQIVGAWNSLRDLTEFEADYLHRQAFISTIGASTRIENAVLTDPEVEWVDTTLAQDGRPTSFEARKGFIIDKLSKDRERSIEEVAGCRLMLTTIYQQAGELLPLTETHIRALHHDLLRYYPHTSRYAGKYKSIPNKVVAVNHQTGEEQVVLAPADPGVITDTAMAELVAWYNETRQVSSWPLLVAVEFVFRFLAIHPFQDGNGRLGRGLFLLALLQSDEQYLAGIAPFLAIDRHVEKNKVMYYGALRQCSGGKFYPSPAGYRYQPLVGFYLRVMKEALRDLDFYRARYASLRKLSQSAEKVLDCFKTNPERRLPVAEIEQEVGLPRRTIQYALKSLTQQGFLQRLGSGAGSRYQLLF